jgi:hypothetical protein
MKGDLDDCMQNDDLKVNRCNQDFVKFLNTKRKLVKSPDVQSESEKVKTSETSHSQADLIGATEKVKRKKRKVSVRTPDQSSY